MSDRRPLKLAAALLLTTALAGCVENAAAPQSPSVGPAPTPPPLKTEPIGVQMTRAEPRLAGTPFRVLLDFERPTDAAFLTPRGPGCQTTPDAAHTGQSSLKVDGPGEVDVKLGSLLGSAPFPGSWTFAGGYFRPAAEGQPATRVTLAYHPPGADRPAAHRTIAVTDPQKWTPAFLDLTPLAAGGGASADVGHLTIRVEGGPILCDDVLVVNNAQTFTAPPADATPGVGWTVKQGGSDVLVERVGRFRLTLKTPEAAPADGWTVDEANELRARFSSADGQHWTIYLDGRHYRDAQFGSLVPMMGNATEYYAKQHASPAELTVHDEFGRLDRDTPGDRNNDGYNERRGSYQLVAKGTRFEVLIRPHAIPLVRPVLEISGLAAGEPLVTVEGRLIEKSTRMANGNLLVELPIALRRQTTVNVTVR